MKKYGLLTLKILLWIIGSLIFLLLLIFVLIRVPAVQDFARKKAVNYLEGKIGTRVEIGRISLDLPKLVVLENVYFEDQKRDTLLAGDTLRVDISMLKLLHSELEINRIDLRGITANVQRTLPDSAFNFDYIIHAFVSEQKKPPQPEDTTSTMKFSIANINLDRIRARFNDAVSASDIDVYIGHFDTHIKDFDLDSMRFSIPKINLSGFNARVVQHIPPLKPKSTAATEAESSTPMNLALQLGTIDLKKIKVYYQNDPSAMKADVNIGNLNVESDHLDLKNQNIALKNISLDHSDILFQLGKTQAARQTTEQASKETEAAANHWRFSLGSLNLDNNNIRFDNFNAPAQPRGMDFAHLGIKNLSFDASDFVYAPDTISAKINDGSFSEKSGFNLKKVQTSFFYGKTQAYLNDLDIQTSASRIRDRIRVNYSSIEDISKNIGNLRIDANLNETRIGFKDILTFVPDMAGTEPFKGHPYAAINITGKVNGQVNNLNIPNLEISGYGATNLKASGKITGLPDMNRSYFDINIDRFSSRKADIAGLLPAGTLPSNIHLPESFQLTGNFKGKMNDFDTRLHLNSSYGSAKLAASYDARVKGSENYRADIRVFNFNVGRLIGQEKTIGQITLAANAAGTGTDPKTMRARFAGKIIKAVYNGYTYRGLNLSGSANSGLIRLKAGMNDHNLSFNLNAGARMQGKYPSVKLALDLDSADLKQLNFSTSPLNVHANLRADLPTADPDYLNGKVLLTNAIVVKSGDRFQLDTISITSTANADSSTLALKSEVFRANLRGKYKLTQLGTAMQDLINKYFSATNPPAKLPAYDPQQLTFDARLVNAPILEKLAPSLKELATVSIKGAFDSQAGLLRLNASAPRIIYGSNDLNNLTLNVNTTDSALNYAIKLSQFSGGQFRLLNTSITGAAQNNTLTTDIQIRDEKQKEHYRIAGSLQSLPSAFVFSLRPNGLILNYQPWTVSADNAIQFGGKGIEAHNFVISNNNQQLSVNTTPPGANNPLKVSFGNFKIETLTQMVKKDSLLIGGTINGNVLLKNLQTSPVFTSDLNIGNFNFKGDTVGNIALKVNNETANAFAADVSISGKGNQVNLTGKYYTGSSSFDMNLNIANLNLKSIEGFTMGNLKQSSGSLNGQLAISGTASAPQIKGGINFNQAAFNVAMLNSYFKIPNNTITFNSEGIQFNDFTLIDSANNKAVLDGMIYTKTFTDFRFGLRLNSNNFRVLNSTAKDNELYYGKLLVNTRLRIEGTMAAPSVNGSLKIDPETDLTVVLPQTDPAIEERQGIVEFIDKDHPELAKTLTSASDSAANQSSGITGMNISVNITIDSAAQFNLLVDAANGDLLKLRGAGELNGGIDPSGKVTLTGIYQMQQGSYQLSFNFLKRRFDIKPGSTITWNGDPTDATLDITALYITDTAPLDLVESQLGGASQATLNTYKQKLPFQVNLAMKGALMKPAISFNIVLPQKNYNVSNDIISNVNTRLAQLRQQPSELNKQVFALLLLNRFVAENPFENSAGGGGVESLARQSVSKILSQQLNNLAGDLIGGVNLNFDLQSSEDYTTGQMKNRTDLNVGLSKRLLNDRLKVTVGSNFQLEGPRQPNQSTSNLAGDVEVEYQLSKDGRYLLRAYQKNEYQVVLQGQVIETGIGFVITMDYNKFREIFEKGLTKEQKQRMRAEKRKRKAENNEQTL